jgi:hypothetical protein
MTLNMLVKGKVDFRHVQIWHWICLSKEKLILVISKYDFEYVFQKKLTLDMSKYDFEYVCQKKLTLNMSKYDFEYVF